MKITKEMCIAELQRFYALNGRSPTRNEMKRSAGYISYMTIANHCGSFNTALLAAGLKYNRQKHDETEKCTICGTTNPKCGWRYDTNKNLICTKCLE
jgi:hypothetical protein